MRRLTLIEYVSVDGVVQAPGHSAEDVDGRFAHGGWTGPQMDAHARYMREALNTMGALLLGRRTYEIWAGHWPTATGEIARMLNAVPKYVASTTLRSGPWRETTVLRDVAQVHELKAQEGKDVVVMGSSELAQALMRDALVDEYRLLVHPVVLGGGKRLFRDGAARTDLRLVESTVTTAGMAVLVYER